MGSVRRLYVYVVSTVSLFALASGLYLLLATALRAVEDALTGPAVLGDWASRGQLSLAIALIAVGGPVFAIHWWLARRGLQASGVQGEEERGSGARAAYVAVVRAVALAFGLTGMISLVAGLLARLFGLADLPTWSEALALALVAVPVWTVFTRYWATAIRATRMDGTAAWYTRLYRYGATFVSLIVMLVGSAWLVATVLSVLVDRPGFGSYDLWQEVVPGQVAMLVVGFGAWLLHWWEANAAIRDARLIGEDDRRTRLRAAYFGGVLLVTVSWSAAIVAGALADLGRWMLGINGGDMLAFLEQVVGPPFAIVPFILAGAWHARRAAREAAGLGPDEAKSARRNGLLLVSLVGLAFLAVGGAQLVELAVGRVAATSEVTMLGDRGTLDQLPWSLAQIIVGALLWLPAWAGILGMRARDPVTERAAPATRAYLFLVVGAATVAAVPTATMTLYRVLDTVLGGEPAKPLLAELAFPISVVIVAVLVGVYHARLLLSDLRAGVPAGELGEAGQPMSAASASTPGAAPMPGELTIELTLHAPAGTDVVALISGMREHLPPGTVLDESDGRPRPTERMNAPVGA